jgi:bifunctional DNase/RNase
MPCARTADPIEIDSRPGHTAAIGLRADALVFVRAAVFDKSAHALGHEAADEYFFASRVTSSTEAARQLPL